MAAIAQTQPNNEIWYTSASGQKISPKPEVFGANILSNEYDAVAGRGVITFDDAVRSIGELAFYQCSDLTSIAIPNCVTSIGKNAFYNCKSLVSVTIPSSVTSIGERAFQGCSGLVSVSIPSSVTSIGKAIFKDCTGMVSITIPGNMTGIEESTFDGCSGLTSVTIPSSVTQINLWAFDGCSGLSYMVVLPTASPSLGSNVFYYVPQNIPVFVPNVENYASWGGFTNIQAYDIIAVKEAAIAVIDATMAGVTSLTDDDIQAVNNCRSTIGNETRCH